MMIDLDKIKKLIETGNLSEVSRQTGIPYRTLQAYKLGENQWLKDTEDKLTKLQSYIKNEGESKMIKFENLKLTTDTMLDDEVNDITYYLNEDKKVTHRVRWFGPNDYAREFPYTAGDPGMTKSGSYTYNQLASQKTRWQ